MSSHYTKLPEAEEEHDGGEYATPADASIPSRVRTSTTMRFLRLAFEIVLLIALITILGIRRGCVPAASSFSVFHVPECKSNEHTRLRSSYANELTSKQDGHVSALFRQNETFASEKSFQSRKELDQTLKHWTELSPSKP